MELETWKERIETWFADKEQAMLDLTEQLVNMDSFSSDGEDVNRVGDVITAWMEEAGFTVTRLPKMATPADEPWMATHGNVLVARTHPAEAGPGVVFMGHMDTVFPAGTTAERPFRLDRRADRATGPGVCDMKSGVVQNMFVARCLKELGLLGTPLTITFSCDEELGSPTSLPVLAEHLSGAIAVFCTEPGYLNGGVTIQRKGSGHMLLEITGKAAHAGRCYEEGASAILELAHKVLAFDKYVDLDKELTVNVGIITGGTSPNTVAPRATARVHITFRGLRNGLDLAEKLRQETAITYIPGTSSHISGGVRLPSMVTDEGTRVLYGLVAKAGDAIGYPTHPVDSKGAAESGYTNSVLGIPSVCNMGPEGADMHSPKEFMVPSTIIPRAKLMALAALEAAEVMKPVPKVDLQGENPLR